MIHIATVHFRNEKWIEVQQKYFARNLKSKYKIYAILDGIEGYNNVFHACLKTPSKQNHGEKLNYLASSIIEMGAADTDWLIFCDGDAFPITLLYEYLQKKMNLYPLIAIQRKERYNDLQPHPAFCCTTVKFWKTIKGDWREGYFWKNDKKVLTDTGGNLLKILKKNEIDWYPMHRSNTVDLHQVFYGIYDNCIYHHGSGFRDPIEDTDKYNFEIHKLKHHLLSRIVDILFRTRYSVSIKKRIHPALRREQKVISKNRIISEGIFKMIEQDYEFYKIFQSI